MLKFTCQAALFAAALIVSFPQEAHARPLSVPSGYPVVPRNRINTLICYMRTQKGAILDLGRLCGDSTSTYKTSTASAEAWRAASLPGGIIQRRAPSKLGGYAAIAFSPSTKRFASIGPRFTQKEAEAQAKKVCGKKDCKVGLSFRNTCGAFVLKGNKAIYAKAISNTQASKVALRRSGRGGKVVVSFCSRQTPTVL